ncbi:slime mold cyclic AMP receptor-domain-containing protein [Neocallimastix lanati (nom. inval.)]|uniref:G-protein coupled receptors family 2 profile 2 domain-containing protein n=1 Tax=Neocallimastix californiae TaxID=1754190 RepID=A0A1Y2DG87_9FUNG|nr:slime mold cyclic AMP receptor-domain-containing protein [Neocallimastix sp. JGI-2020a]ORY58301.1 hypothetical protein LY90DRAFT_506294 [Neocallimastix californiae]|eukprot:ORY58301.1 hypothetical protein LY90DRAFT_506294 [Neocallimastix californiae]
MKLEDDHISILQFFITLSALLSLIGTGAIIINTFLSKNFFGHNNIWNRIIFFMSFCDLCGSIDLLMREQYLKKGNEGACKIQGLTIQFFFISSILWTAVIALNIYLVVVIKKELCDIERYEYIFHILVWGLSLTLTIPLYILENNNTTLYPIMGNATFWCWITTKHGNYRMMFFFGPLWIVFFFNAFVYISMIIICKKRDKDMKPSVVGNTIAKRCNLYLLVLFLTWIWGTINRIQNIHNKDYPIFELHLLHAVNIY